MEETTNVVLVPEEELVQTINKGQAELDALRLNGVTRIESLRNEISNFKRNKQIDPDIKKELIQKDMQAIAEAKEVAAQNKEEIDRKAKELIEYISTNYNLHAQAQKDENKRVLDEAKASNEAEVNDLKAKKAEALERVTNEWKAKQEEVSQMDPKKAREAKENHRQELKDIKAAYDQKINDANVAYADKCELYKDKLHNIYLNKYSAIEKANNKRLPIKFSLEQRMENYVYNFDVKSFFLKNGLYIAIIALLIIATIYYGASTGRFLFNGSTILLILEQTSPRIFLALGVAGLIVLAGTDLSVGRLVGLSAVVTGMLVTTNGTTSLTFFGVSPDFSGIPLGLRVIFAFLLSIICCCVMTGIAGFFTAKFKMHPFVSTLATQLFTFGVIAGITGNSFTGTPDPTVKEIIAGRINGFPMMILYAIIGIIVMWFIWNKTTFGKNMFAVGGNPEAAAVSGISVFKVTLLVFILAGIYYGIGGSIHAIFSGSVRAQTGQGYETDAIAACVVGGVSFTGGVGKVSGVVIGAILFQAINVILQYVGITDANYQLAIKGVIILAAVSLDCAKYLKKK